MSEPSRTVLSHYRIIDKIGEGGWGVVWRAEDITLKRPVALKFLSHKRHAIEEYRVRFLREARLAAALNHPCLCTIYEVAEVGAGDLKALPSGEPLPPCTPYIAMEFLAGRTLAEELRRQRALDIDDLLRIAALIVDGLVAAHARNIVHRDLKPGNVMLMPDGRVKILDFGLAKALNPPEVDDAVFSRAQTISDELSREGLVIGTAAYMSPEQAQGERLDSRSDVFSFGIMLYEMVAGRRPFRGSTPTTTRLRIIEADPEPLPPSRGNLPPELERIIWRCLNKRPDQRYNDTRDLAVALKSLQETSSADRQRGPGRGAGRSTLAPLPRGRAGRYGLAAGLVAIIGAAVLWSTRSGPAPVTQAPPVHRQVTFTGSRFLPEPSPDGQFLGSVQVDPGLGMRLMLKDLLSEQELEVFRGEEILAYEWTTDGREILLRARLGPGDTGYVLVPRLGGAFRRMPSMEMLTWAPDNTRLAGAMQGSREITIFDRARGELASIPLGGDFKLVRGIDWSPGDDTLLVTTLDDNFHTAHWSISANGGRRIKIIEGPFGDSRARWSPRGDAVFYTVQDQRTWHLVRVRIDPGGGAADGDPATVLTGLTSGHFSLGSQGDQLFFAKFHMHSNLAMVEPGDGGSAGIEKQVTSGTSMDYHARISPDGREVCFDRRGNVHLVPAAGGEPRQLTYLESDYAYPAWSPDGSRLAFVSLEGGTPRVWSIDRQGGTARVFASTKSDLSIAWAPGREILFMNAASSNYTLLDPVSEDMRPLVAADAGGRISSPEYSPDGSQIAVYWSRGERDPATGLRRDSGLYLIPLDGSAPRRISEGRWMPIGWSAEGRWIYATNLGESNWSPTQRGEILKISPRNGKEREIFALPAGVSWCDDVAPAGERFLCVAVEYKTDIWMAGDIDARATGR